MTPSDAGWGAVLANNGAGGNQHSMVQFQERVSLRYVSYSMDRPASEWRKFAEHTKRLAGTSDDERTRERLLKMAEEFGSEAKRVGTPQPIH